MENPDIITNESGYYILVRNYMEYSIDETINYDEMISIDLHDQNGEILLVGIEICDIENAYDIKKIRYLCNDEICYIWMDENICENVIIKDNRYINYGMEIYKDKYDKFIGLLIRRIDEKILNLFSECKIK